MTPSKILTVNKYCSEIEWDKELEENCINLVVAPTGSGKTKAFIEDFSRDKKLVVAAPFVSLSKQINLSNPDYEIRKGLLASESVNLSNGIITSFHSIQKALEMTDIDLLVIDEIHYLIDYAGFTYGVLSNFWKTVDALKEKFPKMKIVALTATPHFVRLATFLNFNFIVVRQKNPTSKPSEILVSRSWTKEYAKNDKTFICLYPSKKMGFTWSQKYGGTYIDADAKGYSNSYNAIIEGEMPAKKVFTSTVMSTGISILDPVDIVYTNWLNLSTICQMSARPRQGGHILKVTQIDQPWFLKDGMDEPVLNFKEKDYEYNFKLINQYEIWYSWRIHQDPNDLHATLYRMIWAPELPLEPIY